MEPSAIISLIIFGTLIWGGFAVSVFIAFKKEKNKNK